MSEAETIEPEVKEKPAAIATTKNLTLAPKDSRELSWYIDRNQTFFPECFDTKEKKLAAYELGRALLGDKWALAVGQMCYIKGRLTVYGEVPGALAQHTGQVVRKDLFVINHEYKKICTENKNLGDELFAAICQIQRTGGELQEFFYTIEEAKHAGQYPATRRDGSVNNDSPWMKHTKIMLMRKAMAQAIKFIFPDAVAGVPIAEHDHNMAPDLETIRDVTPSNGADDLMAELDGSQK